MKTLKYNIGVEIQDIEVDDRYYTITFRVTRDGIDLVVGDINSDYCDWNRKEFRRYLKDGGALKLVMESVNNWDV